MIARDLIIGPIDEVKFLVIRCE